MLSGASLKTLALSFGLCYAAVRLFFGRFLKRRERCVVEAKIELCGQNRFPAGAAGHRATRFSTRSPARASWARGAGRSRFALCSPARSAAAGRSGGVLSRFVLASGALAAAAARRLFRRRHKAGAARVLSSRRRHGRGRRRAISRRPLADAARRRGVFRARLNIIRRSCPCFPICCNSFCSPCCRTSRYTISAEARFCPRPSPARRKLRRSRRSAPGQKRRTYAH